MGKRRTYQSNQVLDSNSSFFYCLVVFSFFIFLSLKRLDTVAAKITLFLSIHTHTHITHKTGFLEREFLVVFFTWFGGPTKGLSKRSDDDDDFVPDIKARMSFQMAQ
jgi:hypothetical protein